MHSYKDKTFCGSPNCKNECGRQLQDHERLEAVWRNVPIMYADFCDKRGEVIKHVNQAG